MNRIKETVNWMMSNWKPACALIYTVICLFDFVVFPAWVSFHQPVLAEFILLIKDTDPAYKGMLYEQVYRHYVPFTLSGGGLFHLSFGAILTGAIFGSKVAEVTDSDKK